MEENVKYTQSKQARRLVYFRSPLTFALLIAGLFLAFFNFRFWRETTEIFWRGNLVDAAFLLAVLIFLFILYTTAILLLPGRKMMMVVSGLLFPLGAMAAFCADSFGLAIDREMVRNLGETNTREAMSLFSPRIVLYFVGCGVLPVFLVARSRIAPMSVQQQLWQRLVFLVTGLIISVALVLTFPSRFGAFFHDHKKLHYLSVPGAAIQGIVAFMHAGIQNLQEAATAGPSGNPVRVVKSPESKPLLLFLVVGETARHMNFQLGGYARPTNPQLSQAQGLYYFSNVTSCATTTAVSVPCMFSHHGRERFKVSAAQRKTNALTELAKAGIQVEWRTNNSGSSGIDIHGKVIDFSERPSPLCSEESCLDEILLEGLERQIENSKEDTLVAFHQMGSHGPAYRKRYPQDLAVFKPACVSNDLGLCSHEEIHNAYDNTIIYTDHLLKTKIDLLRKVADRFDTALIYVSDHGESLGEEGIHLHGAPYEVAPDEQKRIPLIVWLSEGYMKRLRIDATCMRHQRSSTLSHDNLYHLLLGAMETRNDFYQRGMDVLAACRSTHH